MPPPKNKSRTIRIPRTQAERVIVKFGNPYAVVEALAAMGIDVTPSTIYRWTYPYPKGNSGLIPPKYHGYLVKAARLAGVDVREEFKDYLLRESQMNAEDRRRYSPKPFRKSKGRPRGSIFD